MNSWINFYFFLEKQLREEAAAEVAAITQSIGNDVDNNDEHEGNGASTTTTTAATTTTITTATTLKKKRKQTTDDKSKQKSLISFSLSLFLVILISWFIRDRNREHAKNTRLRKKAFLQKLQDICERLTNQRNKEIEDRLALGKRIYETVRKNSLIYFSLSLSLN